MMKIGDFGSAYQLSGGEDTVVIRDKKYPVKWTPPEVILTNSYSLKSDVWSFGILLYEIFTFGKIPYTNMSKVQVMEAVIHRNYRMPKPSDFYVPQPIYEIMLKCWSQEPSERPAFLSLLEQFKTFGKKLLELRKGSLYN
jgi:serine/threonine protein kinase